MEDYFDLTPSTEGAALLVMLGGLGLVMWRWWTAGRDKPGRQTIVAEYEPPDKLRPAQVGLLFDEHADISPAGNEDPAASVDRHCVDVVGEFVAGEFADDETGRQRETGDLGARGS